MEERKLTFTWKATVGEASLPLWVISAKNVKPHNQSVPRKINSLVLTIVSFKNKKPYFTFLLPSEFFVLLEKTFFP